MTITEADLSRLGKLARITVAREEQADIQADLNRMLTLIAQLQSVDTRNVAPMAHPLEVHQDVSLRLRDDQAEPTASPKVRDAYMRNAPAQAHGLYLVPTVIE